MIGRLSRIREQIQVTDVLDRLNMELASPNNLSRKSAVRRRLSCLNTNPEGGIEASCSYRELRLANTCQSLAIISQKARLINSDSVPDFALEYKVVAAIVWSVCYEHFAPETEARLIGIICRKTCGRPETVFESQQGRLES